MNYDPQLLTPTQAAEAVRKAPKGTSFFLMVGQRARLADPLRTIDNDRHYTGCAPVSRVHAVEWLNRMAGELPPEYLVPVDVPTSPHGCCFIGASA
jgi:hypothetical protein